MGDHTAAEWEARAGERRASELDIKLWTRGQRGGDTQSGHSGVHAC